MKHLIARNFLGATLTLGTSAGTSKLDAKTERRHLRLRGRPAGFRNRSVDPGKLRNRPNRMTAAAAATPATADRRALSFLSLLRIA